MAGRSRGIVLLFCGKGGVGKTTLSAIAIQLLCRDPDLRVLAVDADPAMGLALTLGIRPDNTLDDILSTHAILKGRSKEALAAIDYAVSANLTEAGNLTFMAMGRPESEGCFCAVNQILKRVIRNLSLSFDAVVIDAEAGVEQINRRVFDSVNRLWVVTDPTRKGVMVADTILRLAARSLHYDRSGLIVNRCQTDINPGDLPVRGFESYCFVPEDPEVRNFDWYGGDPSVLARTKAAERLAAYLSEFRIAQGLPADTRVPT